MKASECPVCQSGLGIYPHSHLYDDDAEELAMAEARLKEEDFGPYAAPVAEPDEHCEWCAYLRSIGATEEYIRDSHNDYWGDDPRIPHTPDSARFPIGCEQWPVGAHGSVRRIGPRRSALWVLRHLSAVVARLQRGSVLTNCWGSDVGRAGVNRDGDRGSSTGRGEL